MIDLTDVLLTEGKVMQYETELGLKHFRYRFGKFRIVEKSPIDLIAENVGEKKLLLKGSVSCKVEIPCARCLSPVVSELTVPFELETGDDVKDYIDGYNLNVDQLVHDEALLYWPERTLCREDCRGLCSTCGQNLNDGPCDCRRTDLDPRMAKVLDIFSNFKEV